MELQQDPTPGPSVLYFIIIQNAEVLQPVYSGPALCALLMYYDDIQSKYFFQGKIIAFSRHLEEDFILIHKSDNNSRNASLVASLGANIEFRSQCPFVFMK